MSRPKGSKNKKHKKYRMLYCGLKPKKKLGRPRKRRRGRPKGSLNKVQKKCRRGRPKGSKKAPTESYDMSNVKRYKFLGYCKCQALISTKELVKKFIYECPACGKRARIKKLLKEIVREKAKTKKEYLDNTIHATHIDAIPLSEGVDIDPKKLRIVD